MGLMVMPPIRVALAVAATLALAGQLLPRALLGIRLTHPHHKEITVVLEVTQRLLPAEVVEHLR